MPQFNGLTVCLQVGPTDEALHFYEDLFGRSPDFSTHADFHEWEISAGGWIQISTDNESPQVLPGRLRFDVPSIREAMAGLADLDVAITESFTLPGVVSIAEFEDPWGNKLGIYEDLASTSEAPVYGGSSSDTSQYLPIA